MTASPPAVYQIHGLLIQSELPLQARRVLGASDSPNAADPVPDYRLSTREPRESPHVPPSGRILAEFRDDRFSFWAAEAREDPARWNLRYAGICDVTLDRRGRTITIHPSPEADPALISVFVEGGILAHVLAAEGLLALHASAVETGSGALAFVGPSGTGKSTLAALLCAAGARLVADDALRVDVTRKGPVCFPGSRRLRLRPAAASLGSEIEGASSTETADGRTAVLTASPVEAPLKLRAALVPEATRTQQLQVQRLDPMGALQELLQHPRLTMWCSAEPIARLFELTADVAAALPVYRATVPWGPPFPPGLAEELIAGVGLSDLPAGVGADRDSASAVDGTPGC